MEYQAKNYDNLLGLPGFSDQLLNNHFTLYKGYVTNTNKITETLWSLAKEEKTGNPEYAELKRRGGWEWNGMRLHELYFENLTKDFSALPPSSNLYQKITKFFGSFENWEKLFKATGAMRGIGWVILYYDKGSDAFFNAWINEHDLGHFAGATPLLVMDVFEHAYMLDYQLKKADYLEAFFKSIDWTKIEARLG